MEFQTTAGFPEKISSEKWSGLALSKNQIFYVLPRNRNLFKNLYFYIKMYISKNLFLFSQKRNCSTLYKKSLIFLYSPKIETLAYFIYKIYFLSRQKF